MFCKSGILIFIFAENSYSIYAHTFAPSELWSPCLYFSFFLSLSGHFFGAQRLSEFTFLPRLLRPSREGALCLHPIKKASEASLNRASPMPEALLAFCVNQRISASFSLLLSHCRLRTTRFQSIKGPQHILCYHSLLFFKKIFDTLFLLISFL